MGRHNIIFPWFFFCRQPPWSCVAPTVCVCVPYPRAQAFYACVWVLHHHLPGCASRSSCFLSIFYLFILCLRTYAPSSLTGVADWVAAWLTSWLPLSLPLPPPPPACHPLLQEELVVALSRVWLLCDSKRSVPGQREGRGGWKMCPYYSLYCFMRHLYAYFCCLLIDVAKYAKNKATNMGPTGATLRATADSHTPPEGKGRMREVDRGK